METEKAINHAWIPEMETLRIPAFEESEQFFSDMSESLISAIDRLKAAIEIGVTQEELFAAVDDFTEEHLEKLEYGRQRFYEVATKAKQGERDNRTGLYNRSAINEFILPRLYESDTETLHFVLFADIVDLRGVNNEYGHKQGDALIDFTTRAILKSIRGDNEERDTDLPYRRRDIAMRWGGDEFVVFGEGGEESINAISHRLGEFVLRNQTELQEGAWRPFRIGGAVLEENTKLAFTDACDVADPKNKN